MDFAELDSLLRDIAVCVSTTRMFDDVDLCVDSISRITALASPATFGMALFCIVSPSSLTTKNWTQGLSLKARCSMFGVLRIANMRCTEIKLTPTASVRYMVSLPRGRPFVPSCQVANT
jgi:hypothetical protein